MRWQPTPPTRYRPVVSIAPLAAALAPVHQHYLLEARQMQALSFAVHIPLVAFGIAFPAMVVFTEWLHLRTGDPLYRTLARRWSRVVLALFAVGVITGTILSFEMGLLWPNFTATFGGVFGLGFAIEGFSFFMEAIFLGIYAYGWDRMSPRAHWLSGIPIVITGFTGSLTVIAVNAWMNHPTGFRLVGGKVADVNPLAALFGNRYLWSELLHMYIAGYMVAGFLIAGCYAFGRLRGRWGRYERVALTIPLTIACLAAPVQVLVGDWIARDVAISQPVKLAAIEGLYKTTNGAPEHVLGWYTDHEVKYGIKIPHLLSLLAFHSWDATVKGLDTVPAAQRPPVNVVRLSFQTMVGIGTLLALLGVVYLVVRVRRRRLPETAWFYRSLVIAGPAATVALIAGWVTTEVGRQPWVVYRVMPTADAVTGAGGIPVGYGTLVITYLAVACGVVWILRRLARMPIGSDGSDSPPPSPHGLPV
jgi:cytochrome d ubiquinol oxidase subunit I